MRWDGPLVWSSIGLLILLWKEVEMCKCKFLGRKGMWGDLCIVSTFPLLTASCLSLALTSNPPTFSTPPPSQLYLLPLLFSQCLPFSLSSLLSFTFPVSFTLHWIRLIKAWKTWQCRWWLSRNPQTSYPIDPGQCSFLTFAHVALFVGFLNPTPIFLVLKILFFPENMKLPLVS